MDDRDRDPSSGSPGRYSRRRVPDEGPADDAPIRRRSQPDVPESGHRLRPGERERARTSRESTDQPSRESGRYRSPSRDEGEPRNWSPDRFRRTSRDVPADIDDRSPSSSRDPYDRLRRVGNRPPRRVEVAPYDELDFDEHGYEDDSPMVERRRQGRSASRSATPGLGQQQFRSMGAFVANPSPELRPIVVGALISAGSLILLSILTLVQNGELAEWYPTRWDAEGQATVYGTSATAWRLPIFALFTTVMALGLGWWLRAREPFAAQFLAVGMLLIHGLIWISAITLLW